MDSIILFSADGHASMPPELYPDYLEARFHADLAALAEDNADWVTVIGAMGTLAPDLLAAVDERGTFASGGESGAYDLDRRLAEMDAEGVAAETVFPGTQCSVAPFFAANQRPWSREHRIAGVRAYHRWLADFTARSGGRLAPIAQPLPSTNMADVTAELRWAAAHGFVGTALPGDLADPELPPLYDAYYEPFWAACAETGLSLSIHAGYGGVQGAGMAMMHERAEMIRSGALAMAPGSDMSAGQAAEKKPTRDTRNDFVLQGIQRVRQIMTRIMLAGVFDRHPSLKLVLTEVRSDWIPASLAHLDARFERGDTPLKRRPSEYWAAHCFVGATAVHPAEVEIRHQIGLNTMMFGRDYPHNDGTWPYTFDWIRKAFAGVPEHEARPLLGGNAIRCYGLDPAKLAALARRIGPRPADLLGTFAINPRKVDHWQDFAGFNNPVPPHDGEVLDHLFDEDLVAMGG